jgi:hypothetical protein
MAPNCCRRQSRKLAPMVAPGSSSTRIAVRHQDSIKNTGVKCSQSLTTLPGSTGTLLCASAEGKEGHDAPPPLYGSGVTPQRRVPNAGTGRGPYFHSQQGVWAFPAASISHS